MRAPVLPGGAGTRRRGARPGHQRESGAGVRHARTGTERVRRAGRARPARGRAAHRGRGPGGRRRAAGRVQPGGARDRLRVRGGRASHARHRADHAHRDPARPGTGLVRCGRGRGAAGRAGTADRGRRVRPVPAAVWPPSWRVIRTTSRRPCSAD
ncbi:hypothetical protein L2X98_20570 [Microbacterium elymi]|uniref:Uncharacterized protein n=1 Tax=Microbacterium elymi TaxID=2909587 RepID=A0ABY5NKF5_9MICO|nr:hypothetical protein [Microbacterium elymi]UUT35661.1 hypothetical protein L2X98_20570 [Microbacterium elymi]